MKHHFSLYLQSPAEVKKFIRTPGRLDRGRFELSLRVNKYYICIEAVGKEPREKQTSSTLLDELRKHFGGTNVVSGDISARDLLFQALRDFRYSIVCAESCTGGALGERITSAPGSSEVFWGSLVTYSEAAKTKIVKVPREIIEKHGAVSLECVRAMVKGAIDASGADVALGVSGIAGPGGGSARKPRGTVWIGVAGRERDFQGFHFLFSGDREEVRRKTVIAGLLYTYWYILKSSMLKESNSM